MRSGTIVCIYAIIGSGLALKPMPRADADPVKISIYYETYCPDSKRFITSMLTPTFKMLQGTNIMVVDMVPYGKARTVPDDVEEGPHSYYCQHGAKECDGNKIHNCAIDLYKDVEQHLAFINCTMSYDDTNNAAPDCAQSFGLDWNAINSCFNDIKSDDLLYEAGKRTHSLDPRVNWVPWIVMNDVHTNQIQIEGSRNLLLLVCSNYMGSLPPECSQ